MADVVIAPSPLHATVIHLPPSYTPAEALLAVLAVVGIALVVMLG